jgi:hypothetical protein
MRRVQLALSLLSAVFLGGFLLLYLYRAELYALTEVSPASISDLYPAASHSAAIVDFEMSRKAHVTLKLRNLENCQKWRLFVDGEPRGQVEGSNPEIRLDGGTHDYELQPMDCKIESPAIDGTSTASVPYSSLSEQVRHFMHRENFLIYLTRLAHAGRRARTT